jgi:hypothetical protein
MLSPAAWSVTGLILSLLGVLILFRFGMPYQTRTGGTVGLALEQTDQAAAQRERRYTVLGWIGLVSIIGGTLCQIVGAYH